MEPFDLGTLVDGTIRSRGWDGRLEIRSEPVPVTTDRSRVDRIVANLIGNALEHGGDGVVVRVGRAEDGAFVEVADAGPGMRRTLATSSIASTGWTGPARDPAAVSVSRSPARTRGCWAATSRLGASPAPVRGSRSACRTIGLLPNRDTRGVPVLRAAVEHGVRPEHGGGTHEAPDRPRRHAGRPHHRMCRDAAPSRSVPPPATEPSLPCLDGVHDASPSPSHRPPRER